MAYKVISTEDQGNREEEKALVTILCDSSADIASLPTTAYAVGSVAKVIGGSIYILNTSNVWTED